MRDGNLLFQVHTSDFAFKISPLLGLELPSLRQRGVDALQDYQLDFKSGLLTWSTCRGDPGVLDTGEKILTD